MAQTNNPNDEVPVKTLAPSAGVSVGKPGKIGVPLMRSKTAASTARNVMSATTGGNFYSPELSTDFLELPQSINEQRNFYRFFYDNNELVGQAIDLLDELPLSKVRLRMPKARNREIAEASLRFCERWAKEIGLLHRLMEIVHDWNLLGEANIFAEDTTSEMPREVTHEIYREIAEGGKIIEAERERPDRREREIAWLKKNYRGWSAIRVIPPEQIHTESFPFTDERLVELIPDAKTRAVIDRAQQGDIHAARVVNSMPRDVVAAVSNGGNIPLNTDPYAGSFLVCMARKKSQYEPRGKSILQRCMRTLVFQDKIRQSLAAISSRHMTPYRVIYAEGMSAEQTEALREQVDFALQDPDFSIITNFQVNWEEMGAEQRLPDWSWVFEMTNKKLYAGLSMSESLLSGESSYSGDRINLEVINTRFMLLRETLQDLVEDNFFRPMCARMGFVEEDEDGNMEVIVPRLSFTRLALRDNNETFDALFNLYQKGSLDLDTILDLLNIDPVTVQEKIKRDFGTFNDATFNEVLRAMYSAAGQNLAESSNFAELVAERLGLKFVKKDEGGGRF